MNKISNFRKVSEKKKFRFHLLSLVHLPQSKEYMSCAFTQKNRKLAKMLTSLGHDVFFYGSEGSDVEEYCNSDNLHFIQTHSLDDIRKDYGEGDNRFEIGYNWKETNFRQDFGGERKPSTLKFYKTTTDYIQENKKSDDFFLNSMGYYYKGIQDEVGLFLSCEPGIGYRGSYPGHFRAFESSYLQNFMHGSENPHKDVDGSNYDKVIPNYFDPADFEYRDKKDDYYLFIGRMIKRKGIYTAVEASKHLNKKLLIVGQGGRITDNGHLVPTDNNDFDIEPGNWEYYGYAGVEERKKLMAGAIATFTPTEYQEPFAGTHIESMLSGTPAITTNFGVFPETIPDVINGKLSFRCNTLEDFVTAGIEAETVNHKDVRTYAERYLMDNVKNDFDKWFHDLYRVYLSAYYPGEKGWYWLP